MLTNQQAITFWEHVAARKWGRYISDIEMQTILRAHRIAGDPATALEIGCDGGRWSQLLSELGWDLICIDVDRQTLGICQKRIPRAKCVLVHPDDRILPCAAGSLQLILCMEVNSVIESDWFVPEAHRTLKDGGVVVGVCWNRRSLRGMWVRATGLLRTDTRNRFYQVAYVRWKRKLRDVGFGVLYQRGLCWFPFPRVSNSSLIPVAALIERLSGLSRLTNLSPWIVFIAQKGLRPPSLATRDLESMTH